MLSFLALALAFVQCTASSLPHFSVKNEELLEMSKILRNEDVNKAKPGQILINYQGHAQSGNGADNAAKPFFTRVSNELLKKQSYRRFIDMMNNFYKWTGVPEPRVSKQEYPQLELKILLLLSDVFCCCARFFDSYFKSNFGETIKLDCASKPFLDHPFAKDPVTFRNSIKHLWFDHYSRAKGKRDTSGFEHVFIGEEKHGIISGLHNWVRFYMLEKNAIENFDYKGFIAKRGNVMAALRFMWDEAFKKTGSILIGTSPEYEMALYTMCFLSRRGKDPCQVELDGCPLSINSYAMIQNRKVYIGTVYPTAGKMTDTCAGKKNLFAHIRL